MGDVSSEPSMEEILSSIKRIIAEEGEAATTARGRRAPKAGQPQARAGDSEEVLELSVPAPGAGPRSASRPAADPAATPSQSEAALRESILSDRAAQASRGALDALSRMVVKPETAGSDTLEGLVRELLRPMLQEWLDANLPSIVDAMVAREIARIAGRG